MDLEALVDNEICDVIKHHIFLLGGNSIEKNRIIRDTFLA